RPDRYPKTHSRPLDLLPGALSGTAPRTGDAPGPSRPAPRARCVRREPSGAGVGGGPVAVGGVREEGGGAGGRGGHAEHGGPRPDLLRQRVGEAEAEHVGGAERGCGGGTAARQPGAARMESGGREHHAAERADARLTGGQPSAHEPEGDDGSGVHGLGGLDRHAHGASLRRRADPQRTTAAPCAGTAPGAAGPTPSSMSAPETASSTSPGAGRSSSPRFSTSVSGPFAAASSARGVRVICTQVFSSEPSSTSTVAAASQGSRRRSENSR